MRSKFVQYKIIIILFLGNFTIGHSYCCLGILLENKLILLDLKGRTLWCWYDQHRWRLFLKIVYNFPEVFFDKIIKIFFMLCFLFEFLRNGEYFLIQLFVFLLVGGEFRIKFTDFFGELNIHGSTNPPHFILVDLLYVADSFENIGNIIDSPFLYL